MSFWCSTVRTKLNYYTNHNNILSSPDNRRTSFRWLKSLVLFVNHRCQATLRRWRCDVTPGLARYGANIFRYCSFNAVSRFLFLVFGSLTLDELEDALQILPPTDLGQDQVTASAVRFSGSTHSEMRLSTVTFNLETTCLHPQWKSSKLYKAMSKFGFCD